MSSTIQITLSDLSLFSAKIIAIDEYKPREEIAWQDKFCFKLSHLSRLERGKTIYLTTPHELLPIIKAEVPKLMSGRIWDIFRYEMRIRRLYSKRPNNELRMPWAGFIAETITLEKKDGKQYLLHSQSLDVRSDKVNILDESYDKWYDIDLGRYNP